MSTEQIIGACGVSFVLGMAALSFIHGWTILKTGKVTIGGQTFTVEPTND